MSKFRFSEYISATYLIQGELGLQNLVVNAQQHPHDTQQQPPWWLGEGANYENSCKDCPKCVYFGFISEDKYVSDL